jgi:carboxyl-terminal processing protease
MRRLFRHPINEAIEWIEKRSVIRSRVDWMSIRNEALALAKAGQDPIATYQAIQFILEQLNDVHGRLLIPDEVRGFRQGVTKGRARGYGLLIVYPECVVVQVTPGSIAQSAGVQIGDVVQAVNSKAPVQARGPLLILDQRTDVQLTLLRPNQNQTIIVNLASTEYKGTMIPYGQRLDHGIGYIDLPSTIGSTGKSYATIAHRVIEKFDQDIAHGWVVDLRRNIGGDLYIMLAAIGPILGEARAGGLVDARAILHPWVYRDGGAFIKNKRKAQAQKAYTLKELMPPVALLTSRLTSSAGEAIVVAFRGRPKTRSFGEPTFGIPTGLEDKRLCNGALLRLSTSLFADRTGKKYFNSIAPDQFVAADWKLLGTERDPVLRLAANWLRSQAGYES